MTTTEQPSEAAKGIEDTEHANNCLYLMDVNDNRIFVNAHSSISKEQPVLSTLVFQLMNPDRAQVFAFKNPQSLTSEAILKKLQSGEKVEETSYIRFFFPYGDSEGDFIDAERGKLISFETESGDWSVAEGIVEESHLSFVISCYKQKVIETLISVYFKCKNIQSYCPEGLTYVYAEISNVVGIQDVIKMFPLQKVKGEPSICRFIANPSTVGEKGQVLLKWDVRSASSGNILPDGIDLFDQPSPQLEVRPNRHLSYTLNLEGGGLKVDSVVPVYVVPPQIEKFSAESLTRKLSWRCLYTSEVALKCAGLTKVVETSGETDLADGEMRQVTLRARGKMYTTYKGLSLQGVFLDRSQIFECKTKVYSSGVETTWSWTTNEVAEAVLYISESQDTWYKVTPSGGNYFKTLSNQQMVAAKLCLTKKDGSTYPDLILTKEEF